MSKLTPMEIYEKSKKENLSHEEYKKLLIENGIIVKKTDLKTHSKNNCKNCNGDGECFITSKYEEGGVQTKKCECANIKQKEE